MVPRGAENGAKRLALEGYESAPDCTENLESEDAGTLDQTGSSGIVLRQNQAERQGHSAVQFATNIALIAYVVTGLRDKKLWLVRSGQR